MLSTAAAAVVLAYLPGALAFRMPGASRAFRAGLPPEERAFWAVMLSVLWSLGVVLVLGGLGWYSLERLIAVNVALCFACLVAGRGHLLYQGSAARPGWTVLVPAALVAIGIWTYFPPSEYVMGGKDPGTYVNEGIQIAQRGRLFVRDPVVAGVPPAFRDLFFPKHLSDRYYGIRFMGFFIDDPAEGVVIGQFPHMFPASIAVGYGLNGLSGARQAIGVWAILGLLAVYFCGARLFGPLAAAAATAFLATNVAEVWFAGYPNSELTLQAFVFAAMLAFTYALDEGRTFFAVAAAAMLAGTLFLRYEIALAFVTFAAAAVLAPVTGRRLSAVFWIVFAAVTLAGVIYLGWPMRAYSAYPTEFLRQRGGWWLVAAGVAAMVAARLLLRWTVLRNAVRIWLPLGLAVVLPLLAIYAYFFREEGARTALGDAMAFRTFGWYLGIPALIASVAGWAVLVRRRFWDSPVFFLTVAFVSVFFFYKLRIVPEHFWAARRFLSVTLPGALLLAAAFVDTLAATIVRLLAPSTWHPLVRVAAVVLAVLPVGWSYWQQSAPVRSHVEYAGLIPALESLARQVDDDDLLVVESRNAGSDLHTLALPLAYIYARPVLVLDSPTPLKRLFEDFVLWADETYDRVLFLGGGGTDLLTRRVSASPLLSDRISVPEYESAFNAYPSGVRRKDFEFGLYELHPTSGDEMPALPLSLAIGTLDDLNVVRFHARETRGDTGTPFRWTTAQSFVILPGLPADARAVTVWLGHGGRPPAAPPAVVEVALGSTVLGTAEPGDAPTPFTFDIPEALARELATSGDPVPLRLRVSTWSPREELGAPDTRQLGVMATRVDVR